MTIASPASDRDLDVARSGASDGEAHLIIAAHVRGYGGTGGTSVIIKSAPVRPGEPKGDTAARMDSAADALVRASRHDCGRDPDGVSWLKVGPAALLATFRASNQGILLDAMSFGGIEAGQARNESIWHLQDPSFDLHSHLKAARGEAQPATSNGLAALSEDDAVKVVAGNIMRRLPRIGDNLLVDGDGSGWFARPGGSLLVGRTEVGSALAGADLRPLMGREGEEVGRIGDGICRRRGDRHPLRDRRRDGIGG